MSLRLVSTGGLKNDRIIKEDPTVNDTLLDANDIPAVWGDPGDEPPDSDFPSETQYVRSSSPIIATDMDGAAAGGYDDTILYAGTGALGRYGVNILSGSSGIGMVASLPSWADNEMVRWHGSSGGTVIIQGSSIFIDNSQNLTGLNDVTFLGVLVGGNGSTAITNTDGTVKGAAIETAFGGVALTISAGVMNLDDTAVTPASYSIVSLIIDQQGRITAASNGTIDISGDTNLSATIPIVLSGDVLSHVGTAVSPGSYTITSLTVDAKGHVTAASNGSVDISADTNLAATSPIVLTDDTLSHAVSGVGAGTYTSVTVDVRGHVTGATNPAYVLGSGTDGTIPLWGAGGVVLGDSILTQSGTLVTVGGTLTVNSDVDGTTILGRAKIGTVGGSSDSVRIGHFDHFSLNEYGLFINSDGFIAMSAPTGQSIRFRINAVTKLIVDVADITINTDLKVLGVVIAGNGPTTITTAVGLLRHQAIDPDIAGSGLSVATGVLSVDAHAPAAHTIQSHDTDTTGAQLTSLADNSMVDTFHRHSELSASDGTPDANFALDATGNATLSTGNFFVSAGNLTVGGDATIDAGGTTRTAVIFGHNAGGLARTNVSILAGTNRDANLLIQGGATVGWNINSNTGVSSTALTIERSDNAGSVIFPTADFIVTSGNVTITGGTITASSNSDSVHILGQVKIGTIVSGDASFAHFDQFSASSFALSQAPNGVTSINAPAGQPVNLTISGGLIIGITSSLVTNEMSTIFKNDLYWTGEDSGLDFANLYVKDTASTTTLNSTGGKVQYTHFNTNGLANSATPDRTNDHVTVTRAGKYLVICTFAVENNAGAAQVIDASIWKNNGATELLNVHAHRSLSAGTDIGSVMLVGIADLAANDTLELWLDTSRAVNSNVTVSDASLSLIMIGGT